MKTAFLYNDIFRGSDYGKKHPVTINRVTNVYDLSKIINFGLNAYIELFYSTNDPNKPLYRILSGPFANKSLVNNARDMLIKNGRKPLILKKCSQT